jgi:nicotinamidase-related amidase
VKRKSGLCAFASTNLDFLLRQKRAKKIVLGGFLTNWYVCAASHGVLLADTRTISSTWPACNVRFLHFSLSFVISLTSSCVESTMRTAYELNYDVYTLR